MLRLRIHRARLGFGFGLANVVSVPLFVLASTPMFEPMWRSAGAAGRHRLNLSAIISLLVLVASVVFCGLYAWWYTARCVA
jgi:hypothetical protein